MINELGNIFLSISASLSFCMFALIFFKNTISISSRFIFCRNFSYITSIFIAASFFILAYAFLIDDFSLRYVANNSNINLENVYKFSAVWGAHEGSILLWVFVMSIWCSLIAIFSKSMPKTLIVDMLSIMGLLLLFFLIFILFSSNPFDRVFPVPLNGRDLNPLLQDPGLIIHPPMLYIGYVGTSVPFVFAISVLLHGSINIEWISWLRKWVISSWMFLTIGISLGSWWAYHELGWGGWWFWDPVENAAFIPWLLSVALFHSLIASENRGVFGKWSILLSIFAFATSLLGTFLVRSGILTSVHAFALDPERGLFILGILAFFIIGSLFIYSIKDFENETTPSYELTSKEFGFLLNNLLLVVLAVSILFGTIFPLIYEAITDGKQISVGAPYFEVILFPFALALGLLQGFALYLSWGTSSSFKFLPRLLIESISIFVLILIILFILFDNLHLTSFATIFLSSWILMGTLQINKNKNLNYWRFLRKRAAVTFAHSGMAILTLGVAVVSSYSFEKEIILAPDDSVEFGNQTILFKNTEDIMGPNYFSKSATMSFSDGSNFYDVLTEKRTYSPSGQLTTEAGIKTEIFQDLYISMGDNLEADIWSFKVQIKPFIRWIWLGALMIAIGSLLGGIKRVRKT